MLEYPLTWDPQMSARALHILRLLSLSHSLTTSMRYRSSLYTKVQVGAGSQSESSDLFDIPKWPPWGCLGPWPRGCQKWARACHSRSTWDPSRQYLGIVRMEEMRGSFGYAIRCKPHNIIMCVHRVQKFGVMWCDLGSIFVEGVPTQSVSVRALSLSSC